MRDIFEGTGTPLSQDGFESTRRAIGGDTESLWALLRVETRGFGFLPDRRPKILFERHIFHGRTGGRFSRSHPDISASSSGGYIGGGAEYQRLKRAMLLDRRSALESASWGLGQVMGFNATKIGYASVDAMVTAFAESEDAQLDGCAAFINATPALKTAYQNRKWARVAFFYNGKHFAKNKYDKKLEEPHATFKAKGSPDVGTRRVQAFLTYLGHDPKGIDGLIGNGTRRALAQFAASYKSGQNEPQMPQNLVPETGCLHCLEHSFKTRFSPVS